MEALARTLNSWKILALAIAFFVTVGFSLHVFISPTKADIAHLMTHPPLDQRVRSLEAETSALTSRMDFVICSLIEMDAGRSIHGCKYLLPQKLSQELDKVLSSK